MLGGKMTTFIFGHKNPDTDTVTSAIATSFLKNKLGHHTEPCVLGSINKESKYILDFFQIIPPKLIKNVKTQIKDINYDKTHFITPNTSILSAYKLMESKNLRTLPVVDYNNKLIGLVTMKDIAIELIKGDFRTLKTSLSNLEKDLNGTLLVEVCPAIEGCISVIAYYYKTIEGAFTGQDIIIVGDRYSIIEHAIQSKVKLIIITGNTVLPAKYLELARLNGVNLMTVPTDTYTTAKLINKCKYVSLIMQSKDLIKFNQNEYLEDIKDDMITTNYRNYPVVDDDNIFLGFVNRKHLLNPGKKKVILVDHNEYAQSAEGLEEANILEIIDHHKIGDISTSMPISFRNIPVGSTCTIVYGMFKEQHLDIPFNIAGLLLSGIISDTLLFKSPTTTEIDISAAKDLNQIVNLDLDEFAMGMFKAGTSLEGYSIEEIFYKDFKEFNLDGYKTGMGQVFTLDIEKVMKRKDDFISYINETHKQKNYYLTLLLVTDILKEGSYLLFQCDNPNVISTAFNITLEQGVFVEHLVSRKKQVVPKVLEAIAILK